MLVDGAYFADPQYLFKFHEMYLNYAQRILCAKIVDFGCVWTRGFMRKCALLFLFLFFKIRIRNIFIQLVVVKVIFSCSFHNYSFE